MLHAEIKNKISFPGIEESDVRELDRMEELLTSNVFGVLKNLNSSCWKSLLPDDVLKDFEVSDRNVEFWRRFSSEASVVGLPNQIRFTEPDITLETNEYFVLIEVKYLSPFGKGDSEEWHQLKREWDLGNAVANGKQKEFHFITLTPFDPAVERRVFAMLDKNQAGDRIHIRYWEDVYQSLYSQLTQDLDEIDRRFIIDLVQYLRVKGFDADKQIEERERPLSYYLGEEDAARFLDKISNVEEDFDDSVNTLTIAVGSLGDQQLTELREAIRILLNSDSISRVPLTNTISEDKSVITNFLLDTEEKPISDFFYNVLAEAYYLPYIRLNGKRDFSVKARIKNRGNREISLFTVRRNELTIQFQLRR